MNMEKDQEFDKQALSEHLAELRSCLLISLAAAFAGFAICYSVKDRLSVWFLKPLIKVMPENQALIYTAYQEGFFFI